MYVKFHIGNLKGTSYVLFYFKQNKNSDFCAPLTSFDWNEVDPNLLGTSSIDTTCTIWGLEVGVLPLSIFFVLISYRSKLPEK